MDKLNIRQMDLHQLYGALKSAPLPAGAINWKMVGLYSAIGIGSIAITICAIHILVKKNTALYEIKFKSMMKENAVIMDNRDKIIEDLITDFESKHSPVVHSMTSTEDISITNN